MRLAEETTERKAQARSYVCYWNMTAGERVEVISEGVPIDLLLSLARDTGRSRSRLCSWLGLSATAIGRRGRLNRAEGASVLGLARLLGEAEQIVAESSSCKDFDIGGWLARWLESPNTALGGELPCDIVALADGRDLLATLLRRSQFGIYV